MNLNHPPNDIFPNGIKDLSIGLLSSDQKNWLGDLIATSHIQGTALAKLTGLKARTLQRYGTMRAKGTNIRKDKGQPKVLDESDAEELTKFVSESDVCKSKVQVLEKISILYQERRRTLNSRLPIRDICSKNTLRSFMNKTKILSARAEVQTNARRKAIADKRNTLSFASMNRLMSGVTVRDLVINMDATQFRVGRVNDGTVEVSFVKEQRLTNSPLKVEESNEPSDGSMAFFIKYFLIMTAGGFTSDPIFIIADDKMPAEEIDQHEVKGLGIGTNLCNKGWVVFCKSRVGNLALFRWINESVLIPFVEDIRINREISHDIPAWFQLDGEQIQIKCYEDPAMIAKMNQANITIGKPPGSTTAVTQPADRYNCFKGPKTTLKRIHRDDVSDNEVMIDRLDEVLKVHISRYTTKTLVVIGDDKEENHTPSDSKSTKESSKSKIITKEKKIAMSSEHKKMAIFRLLRVQLALMISMRPDVIRNSFKMCGIFPFSLQVILDQNTSKFSNTERINICTKIRKLARVMMLNGEIKDDVYRKLNLINDEDDENAQIKDNKPLYCRRSVILTNTKTIEVEHNKRKAKLEEEEAKQVKAMAKKQKLAQTKAVVSKSKK